MISGIRVYYLPESPAYYLPNVSFNPFQPEFKDNFGFDIYKKG